MTTQFKIGDKVTFTNDYGAKFSGHTVTGFVDETHMLFKYGNHILIDTDAHWFPHKASDLKIEA